MNGRFLNSIPFSLILVKCISMQHTGRDPYVLELHTTKELVPWLFSLSYFQTATSLGVKLVVPLAGYTKILRESWWIKSRLSRNDPTKWSRSGYESISSWEKRCSHKPNFLLSFISLVWNDEIYSIVFVVRLYRNIKK